MPPAMSPFPFSIKQQPSRENYGRVHQDSLNNPLKKRRSTTNLVTTPTNPRGIQSLQYPLPCMQRIGDSSFTRTTFHPKFQILLTVPFALALTRVSWFPQWFVSYWRRATTRWRFGPSSLMDSETLSTVVDSTRSCYHRDRIL